MVAGPAQSGRTMNCRNAVFMLEYLILFLFCIIQYQILFLFREMITDILFGRMKLTYGRFVMKCLFCGSEKIETGIPFGAEGSGPEYYVNEEGRAVVRHARVYCDLCLDCGTLVRTYIKDEGGQNWAHDPVALKSVKTVADHQEKKDARRKTLDYYNQRSDSFADDTKDLEFSDIQDYFLQKGYRVEAADGSEEMVRIATETAGIPVRLMLFEELDEEEKYDGVFACASLLHVRYDDLPDILNRVAKALKKGGIAYVSFKYGTFEGYRSCRYFTDLNEEKFLKLMSECDGLEVVEEKITSDVRPGREKEKWLNAILKKI